MQQFYYLAVLFVAGGIGSALIVAADLRTRRQPMRIMESVWAVSYTHLTLPTTSRV